MEQYLAFGVYIAIGAVFVVLAFGVVNLVRTDSQARSRSNKLMRLRVLTSLREAHELADDLGWVRAAGTRPVAAPVPALA